MGQLKPMSVLPRLPCKRTALVTLGAGVLLAALVPACGSDRDREPGPSSQPSSSVPAEQEPAGQATTDLADSATQAPPAPAPASPQPPTAPDKTSPPAQPVASVSIAAFVTESCSVCHGLALEGGIGPALTVEALTGPDELYFEVIKAGAAGTSMPSWSEAGLSDAEITAIVRYLKTGEEEQVGIDIVDGGSVDELAVTAASELTAPPAEKAATTRVAWPFTNETAAPILITRFRSATLNAFHVGALPVRVEPGRTEQLTLVVVPNPELEPGSNSTASATATIETIDGTRSSTRSVIVDTLIAKPQGTLAFTDVFVGGLPVRLASWGQFLYVALFDGSIDVYRLGDEPTPALVEHITTIAETPNHGPQGGAQPAMAGRLIGGMTVGDDGSLYVTHSDPRLNEGDFVQTGHLADLNSGMITALRGRPGTYNAPANRTDLVSGLPRNVTNHVPSGMDIGPDGWLYIAIGAMTDSGIPDPSKPDDDTPLSGAIMRVNLGAAESVFPVELTQPGPDFAGTDALVPGAVELYATGVRNGFGLTFDASGGLYLTDQSADGGSAPRPLGERGPEGVTGNIGADHLHRVGAGEYLGQPNISRGEFVLNDGSDYETPVASPGYVAPVHVFGIHNSATGLVEYSGDLFPDLEGWLLVGKFSGGLGLEALELHGEGAETVRALTSPPDTRNVTDVVVGPDGEIVIAEFWEQRIRISRGYAP